MEAEHWVLVILGLVVIGGFAVALFFSAKARVATMTAAADLVEQWHKRDVAKKQAILAKLNKDATTNAAGIKKLQDQLAAKRAQLETKYIGKGATADEVIERLRRLGL